MSLTDHDSHDCEVLKSILGSGHYEIADEGRVALQTVIHNLDGSHAPTTTDDNGRTKLV